jgi:hypothetical protein
MPSPIEKSRIQGYNDETPEHGTQREHRASKTDRRRQAPLRRLAGANFSHGGNETD